MSTVKEEHQMPKACLSGDPVSVGGLNEAKFSEKLTLYFKPKG